MRRLPVLVKSTAQQVLRSTTRVPSVGLTVVRNSLRNSHHYSHHDHLATGVNVNVNDLTILNFFTSKKPKSSKDHNEKDKLKEVEKMANLGSMVEYLKNIIPESLNKVPESSKLDENIQLRISPTITSNVPVIKGHLSYFTSLKATQLIFKNFVLPVKTKFHVVGCEIDHSDKYGVLGSGVTKIVMHWKTCDEGCHHLFESVDESNGSESGNGGLGSATSEIVRDDKHRMIFGIYVFELNEMNDKILVHNVENVEVANDGEKKIDQMFGGNLVSTN